MKFANVNDTFQTGRQPSVYTTLSRFYPRMEISIIRTALDPPLLGVYSHQTKANMVKKRQTSKNIFAFLFRFARREQASKSNFLENLSEMATSSDVGSVSMCDKLSGDYFN